MSSPTQAEYDDLQRYTHTLEQKIAGLERGVAPRAHAEPSTAKEEHASVRVELAELKQRLDKAAAERDQLLQDVERLEREQEILSSDLQRALAERESAAADIRKANAEIDRLSARTSEELAGATRKQDTIIAVRDQYLQDLELLESEQGKLARDYQAALVALESARSDLRKANGDLQILNARVTEEYEARVRLQKEIEVRRTQVEELTTTIQALRSLHESTRASADESESLNTGRAARIQAELALVTASKGKLEDLLKSYEKALTESQTETRSVQIAAAKAERGYEKRLRRTKWSPLWAAVAGFVVAILLWIVAGSDILDRIGMRIESVGSMASQGFPATPSISSNSAGFAANSAEKTPNAGRIEVPAAALAATTTATPTPTVTLTPTSTPSPTSTPTPTSSPSPTNTPTATATPFTYPTLAYQYDTLSSDEWDAYRDHLIGAKVRWRATVLKRDWFGNLFLNVGQDDRLRDVRIEAANVPSWLASAEDGREVEFEAVIDEIKWNLGLEVRLRNVVLLNWAPAEPRRSQN